MAKKDVDYEYNPVKVAKDGTEAERVVWTTKAFNIAVDAIKKGLPLKANPFIGKDTQLLKPDLVYRRTEEEIQDYIHCAEDPVYFGSKCFLMTPDGLQQCKLRDYQEDYIHHLQKNRFSILLAARQVGKSVTTAIYCLWVILFNTDKAGLILSKSGPAGIDLMTKIKDMYRWLPYHLKAGTMKWNQTSISFDNNSSISTEAFSPTAGLGKTINFLILDEFAWCPPNEVELFYENIIPTVTTITDSNVCIMSTQNGFNLFYRLWKGAIEKRNIYAPFKIDWWQVPQWDPKTKTWQKRDEKWKEMMVGVLGSEEAFYYQYGTVFSASDKCLVSREALTVIRERAILYEARTDLQVYMQHADDLKWDPEFDLQELSTGWFCILVDLAEGGGGDYTVFSICKLIDKDTLRQVGHWRSNKVNIEDAALEFWLLIGQLFQNERCIISLEWNTYGALFYTYLLQLNEETYRPEHAWRFRVVEEFDTSQVTMYKKSSIDEAVPGIRNANLKTIPGIRFSSSNKITACALLKMLLERGHLILTDVLTIGELENFEDKNGTGTYKASDGHDDLIMTFAQIPMLQQTPKYKLWVEDFEAMHESNSTGIGEWSLYGSDTYSPRNPFFTNEHESSLYSI